MHAASAPADCASISAKPEVELAPPVQLAVGGR